MSDHVNIFATSPGARIYIGGFGVATFEAPLRVPRAVGADFRGRADLRVEGLAPKPVIVQAREASVDIPVSVINEPRKGKEGK